MQPHKCPVCDGKGAVPGGYYTGSRSDAREVCRSCTGTGVVWENSSTKKERDPNDTQVIHTICG